MKIKRKVQLTLPQLIEYAWNNDVRGKRFETITQEGPPGVVHVTDGRGISIDRNVFKDELFTVEIEEDITENTVIPILVTKNINDDYNEWTGRSIKSFVLAHMEAIYIPDDDLTLTLIWTREKGLVG